jgi:hypothetical protein
MTMGPSIRVAITGTKHYFGTDFFKIGMIVRLVKDPENPYDPEAIRVEIPPIGKVGYVANSSHTVPRGCRSAGRIYDTFEKTLFGVVCFVVKDIAILEVTNQWKNGTCLN